MEDKEFRQYVNNAVSRLPKEFRNKIENVEIVVDELPSSRHYGKIGYKGGFLLGLYEGVPKTKRSYYGVGGALPDKITLFKNNILLISRTRDEIEGNVYKTLFHEIGHHLGLSE